MGFDWEADEDRWSYKGTWPFIYDSYVEKEPDLALDYALSQVRYRKSKGIS